MKSSFKKDKSKLHLLTDIDMFLMANIVTREGICYSIYRYVKANNRYMKDYDKNKESPYIQYWNVNNLYGWKMPQKLPVNNFDWIKDASQFNENFIKSYNEEGVERYFLEVDIQYQKE